MMAGYDLPSGETGNYNAHYKTTFYIWFSILSIDATKDAIFNGLVWAYLNNCLQLSMV